MTALRCLLWLLMVVVVYVSPVRTAEKAKRPNILFIYTDDHSYRTVGCYPQSYPWVKTPTIDRLAAQGVRFEYAYIGTWCMPSRATLLTGHHQFEAEKGSFRNVLNKFIISNILLPVIATVDDMTHSIGSFNS